MRQTTFWPHRGTSLVRPLLVAALAFFVTGLLWAGTALFETVPDRSTLKPVHGQVESVTKVDSKGRLYSSYRYDFDVKTFEGPRNTYWLDQDWLGARNVFALDRKTVSFLVTGGDAWIMAINSGGTDILTYDTARQLWKEDKSFRVKFGLAVTLFGFALGGIHYWRVRRGGATGAA